MVKKAISKMKSRKAAGTSGIVVEMIKAAGDTGATMSQDIAIAIIRDGRVPTDWEESFIVCLYKGKGDALDRGNYRGLKLTEQAMEILERIVDGLIRQVVSIDNSQFGFVPGEGPPIPIKIDMVKKAISKMKSGKAAGTSGIVVEMIKAAGDTGATMSQDLAVAIIRDGKVPNDWEESFIVCLYKDKGDALDRGNYRGLKLTEQAMEILERIVDGLIRQVVSIDDSQFGFVPGEGPPIPITIDMVKKAISKMKSGKAAGTSGFVEEMIKAAGDTGATMSRDLAIAIIRDGKVPNDWEESFIVCLYKGKGDALDRGNYRGLKLTEQAMEILERIVDGLIRQVVSIDDSQFGFVPGRGTTDAIFVVRQLQEKYLAVNKRLYMAIVDLEKAFDLVPWKVIWWALRMLGVEEWIVRLVQGKYANARSGVRVGEGFSKEFEVKVGVHQGSVLSPLLFIIVLQALSREFRAGVPWEDLYADDLVIIADSLEECVRRLLIWKEAMEKKGLRVNAGKTKVMICGTGLDLLQSSGEYTCAVCRTGVGNNSIYCNGCKLGCIRNAVGYND